MALPAFCAGVFWRAVCTIIVVISAHEQQCSRPPHRLHLRSQVSVSGFTAEFQAQFGEQGGNISACIVAIAGNIVCFIVCFISVVSGLASIGADV